jgi:TonB family protein
MTGRTWALLIGLFVVSVTGCKSAPKRTETRWVYSSEGNVSAQQLQAPAGQSYPNDPGTTYTVPYPAQGNAVPQYPAGLLSSRLPPVNVMVRLVVDGDGAVTEATVVDGEGVPPEFGQSVLTAVRGWRFAPLKRRRDDKVESLPFSQQYRFVFTQVNGRALVQSAGAVSR